MESKSELPERIWILPADNGFYYVPRPHDRLSPIEFIPESHVAAQLEKLELEIERLQNERNHMAIDAQKQFDQSVSEKAQRAALEVCDYCGIDQNDSLKVAAIITEEFGETK